MTTTDKTLGADARYIARFPNNREGRRGLALLRKYCNRSAGRLRTLFSGPRTNRYDTNKADATAMRVYWDAGQGSAAGERLRAAIYRAQGVQSEIDSLRFRLNALAKGREQDAYKLADTEEGLRRALECEFDPAWVAEVFAYEERRT